MDEKLTAYEKYMEAMQEVYRNSPYLAKVLTFHHQNIESMKYEVKETQRRVQETKWLIVILLLPLFFDELHRLGFF